MAGSMKDIKLRIKSVESTMQITRAMQLVATSKLRRAKERMELSRPYAEISRSAIMAAAASCNDDTVPYITPREVKRRCYIVVAGDRGLAGGYNANIFKLMAAHSEGYDYCVLPLGRKAVDKFTRMDKEVLSDEFIRVEGASVSKCYRIAKMISEGYLAQKFDEVWMIYTDFKNMMSQEAVAEQLLPISKPEVKESNCSTIYEPDAETTLVKVVPDFLAGRVYSAMCDSYASEISARRSAMDSATKNAGEMIGGLRLKYNRARQGAITQEITEIVAGSEH